MKIGKYDRILNIFLLNKNCKTLHFLCEEKTNFLMVLDIYTTVCFSFFLRLIYNESEFCAILKNLEDDDTNVVAFSTKMCMLLYNSQNAQHPLASTKDNLYMFSSIFLFRKTSPLVTEFNKQLQSLKEAGLIDYWIRCFTGTRKSNAKRNPTKLEMTSILAAFQFCGVVYIVSFVIFILEMFSMRSKCIKRIIDYLTY